MPAHRPFGCGRLLVGLTTLFCCLVLIIVLYPRILVDNVKNNYAPLENEDCYCDDELFCYSSAYRRGAHFPCSLYPKLEEMKLLSSQHPQVAANFRDEDIVFVTFASEDHFAESRKCIQSIRLFFPTNRIIYYDVGISEQHANELRNVCNLEVRRFQFDKYPLFVRHLKQYHFKKILMAEVWSEGDAIPAFWAIDASARFTNGTVLKSIHESVRQNIAEDFVMRSPSVTNIKWPTNFGMLSFLPMNPGVGTLMMRESNSIFIRRSPFSAEILKWDFLCGMHEPCMAPDGHKQPCDLSVRSDASCHRYDQSSLNILLGNVFGRSRWLYSWNGALQIAREDQKLDELRGFECGVIS